MSPTQLAADSAAALVRATGVDKHDVAVVLGSGWAPAADRIGAADAEVPLTDLPGFAPPSALGHVGKVRSVTVAGKRVLVFLGRTHLYEGHGIEAVVHGVRTAAAAGCQTILLTNAAGGINADYRIGQPVLISDHLNLTARSPLVGANFVDLVDAYSPRLRSLARSIDASLAEGVYAALPGPHFETPAEIRMLATIGADLVGMSTALEAIAARAAGLDVLGLSMVTNVAAGLSDQPPNHAEVLAAGKAAAGSLGDLLAGIVAGL